MNKNQFSLPDIDDEIKVENKNIIPRTRRTLTKNKIEVEPSIENNEIYVEEINDEEVNEENDLYNNIIEENHPQENIDESFNNYIEEEAKQETKQETKKKSFLEKIKSELGNQSQNVENLPAFKLNEKDEIEEEDDYKEEIEKIKKVPKNKKHKKKKKKLKIYKKISDLLFKILHIPFSLLTKIPIIGKFIKLLNPILNILCKLWLPVIIAGIFLFFNPMNLFENNPNVIKVIEYSFFDNNKINVIVENVSDMYADFSINGSQSSWFGLKTITKCEGPIEVLDIGAKTTIQLICNQDVDKDKDVKFEIENYN